MSVNRIYIVTAPDGAVVLVKASNQAQALRHVAKAAYTVRYATSVEVADHMGAGVKVHDATREPTDLVEEAQQ